MRLQHFSTPAPRSAVARCFYRRTPLCPRPGAPCAAATTCFHCGLAATNTQQFAPTRARSRPTSARGHASFRAWSFSDEHRPKIVRAFIGFAVRLCTPRAGLLFQSRRGGEGAHVAVPVPVLEGMKRVDGMLIVLVAELTLIDSDG